MGLRVPLRKKMTLRRIRRHSHEINDDDHPFPSYFLIMMPNTVGTIVKSYCSRDYPSVFLCASVFAGFVLLECCLFKYLSLPKNEKSCRKFWLKLTMWFLFTAISFGFVYQFTYFFTLKLTVVLYAFVMVCSAFHHYVEDEIALFQNRTLDAGKLNCSDSVWEQV